jgi:hypothetical protein
MSTPTAINEPTADITAWVEAWTALRPAEDGRADPRGVASYLRAINEFANS